MEEENLQENCNVVGTYYLKELKKLKDQQLPFMGDVRGKGLMIGVELVDDTVRLLFICLITHYAYIFKLHVA